MTELDQDPDVPEDEPQTSTAHETLPRAFGALLRQRRGVLGLSQSDLALASGVGRRFIIELEAGKASCQLGKALVVAEALGIRVIELLKLAPASAYHLNINPGSINVTGQEVRLTGPARDDDGSPDLPDDIDEPSP